MFRFTTARLIVLVALAMSLCTPVSFAADELVDNPQYAGWAKFKPGTSVRYINNTEAMGQKHEAEITMTLIALTPEKATIETTMSMTTNGKKVDVPSQKMDIAAKVTKAEAKETGEPDGSAKSDMKKGTERIEAAGKSYDCKWTEVTSE